MTGPKVVLDFARGRVRTGEDARDFTTEGMVAARSLPFPPTPFQHADGEFTVMSWKADEAFFFKPQDLLGREISAVYLDRPEPGCLLLEFTDGGGVVITFEERE